MPADRDPARPLQPPALREARERLQPALLDRLTDDASADASEPEGRRVLTKAQLRAAVLRDLGWLFNAVRPTLQEPGMAPDPVVADSVLAFGLPPMSGLLASRVDVAVLERTIRQTIERFEPRILRQTLEVRALEVSTVLDTHNVIEFEIRGHLWAQPVPLEILLRTQIDLEAGQVKVRDATGGMT